MTSGAAVPLTASVQRRDGSSPGAESPRPSRRTVSITKRDVDLAGGPDDHVLTFFQMTVRYWQAKRAGDPRAWLYREVLVRRFLKRQGEA